LQSRPDITGSQRNSCRCRRIFGTSRTYVDVLQLRSAVERVLADRSFAENARAVGDRLRVVGGAALAADLVEKFAQRAAK
jgi:UDP:flavonoid glycosyltransferase YjiC (YdhE family)